MSLSLTAKVKLVLLIAAIALGIALPYSVGPYLVATATLGLVYGLLAMSVDLMGGYAGLITLGQASIMAVAAYGVGFVSVKAGGGYGEQILVGLAAGLVVSVVFALMAMRTSAVYFIMVTLAQGMIVWGLSIRLTDVTGAENGLSGISRPPAVAAYWKYYYLCLAVLLVCGGLMYVIVRSPFGLSLRGLRESETRLRVLGYNTALCKFSIYVLSGFFATTAGILYVYLIQFISASAAHLATSALAVLMAILGGIGTLVGPLVGAFVVVFIQNVVSVYVERWPTVMGLIFIVVILFARQGFVGAVSQGWRSFLRRRGEPEAERVGGTALGVVEQPAAGPDTDGHHAQTPGEQAALRRE